MQDTDECNGLAPALTVYAARLLRDPERARDAVQETAVKWADALRAGGALPENPRAWLYRVTRNCCLDILRKDSRLHFTADPEAAAGALYGARAADDPARAAADKEERENMLRKIGELPPRQQEALRLKFQENLSYAEIAQITGDSVDTVAWLLHEALKALRRELAAG